jgi:hypothetical protein
MLLLAACSTQQTGGDVSQATASLPVSDTVLPKLAPQSGIDPTVADPLIQARCDFIVQMPIDDGWFAGRGGLTADARIALARAVLGPSNNCRRVELVSVRVSTSQATEAGETEAEQIRQFFVARGIAAERIEAHGIGLVADGGCRSAKKCVSATIAVEVRGVGR